MGLFQGEEIIMKCFFCDTTGVEGGVALTSFYTGIGAGNICPTCMQKAIYFYLRDHDKKRKERAENE